MFKIPSKDQSETNKLQGNRLFLHGVKSNKVKSIISSGEMCKEDCTACCKPVCARYASELFNLEVFKSNRLREKTQDRTFMYQKLAYIFVVAEKGMNEKTTTNEIDTDSRGCYIKDGSFKVHSGLLPNNCDGKHCRETIPAYLLVVEVTVEVCVTQ